MTPHKHRKAKHQYQSALFNKSEYACSNVPPARTSCEEPDTTLTMSTPHRVCIERIASRSTSSDQWLEAHISKSNPPVEKVTSATTPGHDQTFMSTANRRSTGDSAVRRPPYACDACHYVPARLLRGDVLQCGAASAGARGRRGVCGEPAHLPLGPSRFFLASDMLFLRLFPGGFGVFAFSQCDSLGVVC